MPISGTKTTGCKDLLKLMKDDELFSLADTVTKKQVEVARSKKGIFKDAQTTYRSSSRKISLIKIWHRLFYVHTCKYRIERTNSWRAPVPISYIIYKYETTFLIFCKQWPWHVKRILNVASSMIFNDEHRKYT